MNADINFSSGGGDVYTGLEFNQTPTVNVTVNGSVSVTTTYGGAENPSVSGNGGDSLGIHVYDDNADVTINGNVTTQSQNTSSAIGVYDTESSSKTTITINGDVEANSEKHPEKASAVVAEGDGSTVNVKSESTGEGYYLKISGGNVKSNGIGVIARSGATVTVEGNVTGTGGDGILATGTGTEVTVSKPLDTKGEPVSMYNGNNFYITGGNNGISVSNGATVTSEHDVVGVNRNGIDMQGGTVTVHGSVGIGEKPGTETSNNVVGINANSTKGNNTITVDVNIAAKSTGSAGSTGGAELDAVGVKIDGSGTTTLISDGNGQEIKAIANSGKAVGVDISGSGNTAIIIGQEQERFSIKSEGLNATGLEVTGTGENTIDVRTITATGSGIVNGVVLSDESASAGNNTKLTVTGHVEALTANESNDTVSRNMIGIDISNSGSGSKTVIIQPGNGNETGGVKAQAYKAESNTENSKTVTQGTATGIKVNNTSSKGVVTVLADGEVEASVNSRDNGIPGESGIGLDLSGNGQINITADSISVADGGTPVQIGEGVSDNVSITVWKVEINDQKAEDGQIVKADENNTANNAEAVENNIRYIIKVGKSGKDYNGLLFDDNNEDDNLKKSESGYYAARAYDETEATVVTLKAAKDYKLLAVIHDDKDETGKSDVIVQDGDGNYKLLIPKGGGVWLEVKLEKIEAQETAEAVEYTIYALGTALAKDGKSRMTLFNSRNYTIAYADGTNEKGSFRFADGQMIFTNPEKEEITPTVYGDGNAVYPFGETEFEFSKTVLDAIRAGRSF